MENKDILDKIKSEKVRLVEMQFSDILGSVKSVTIPEHKLGEALERGLWFDGSSIEGFTRIFESDMMLMGIRPQADMRCPYAGREAVRGRPKICPEKGSEESGGNGFQVLCGTGTRVLFVQAG